VACALALVPHAARAQPRPPDAARLTGRVVDSLAGIPLAGALVQLVPDETLGTTVIAVRTADDGTFAVSVAVPGPYRIGFFHPRLDSLGLTAPVRLVRLRGARRTRIDLAIPAAPRLRATICGPAPRQRQRPRRADGGGVLVGTARQAPDGAPRAGISVAAEWVELELNGAVRRVRLVATTSANGWFALCDVPATGTFAVEAADGRTRTDRVTVALPTTPILVQDLWLPAPADDAAPLRGQVTDDVGTAIPQAEVRIGDLAVRTDDDGRFVLRGVPGGTRQLEARAIGHFAGTTPVIVRPDAPPIAVTLTSLGAALDTVRVRAARQPLDRVLSGFETRRREGIGRFVTREEIARRQPATVGALLQGVVGLRLEGYGPARVGTRVRMRGGAGECEPDLFVNGMPFGPQDAEAIDLLARPEEVVGIEVYSDITRPAAFVSTAGGAPGCGVIVLWTR
jgi:hypothetical protein